MYSNSKITKSRLHVFLQCLTKDTEKGIYEDIERQVVLVTAEPRELFELPFEVKNSLDSSIKYHHVKQEIQMVLNSFEHLTSCSPEYITQIISHIDLQYRTEMFDTWRASYLPLKAKAN